MKDKCRCSRCIEASWKKEGKLVEIDLLFDEYFGTTKEEKEE